MPRWRRAGSPFPTTAANTVNLAPADLPKESGRFDLPIALGILAASGVIDPARLDAFEFAGDLSLAGELRPVRGALALALAAQHGVNPRTLVLPAGSAELAARVQGLDVRSAVDLLQVVRSLLPAAPRASSPRRCRARCPCRRRQRPRHRTCAT